MMDDRRNEDDDADDGSDCNSNYGSDKRMTVVMTKAVNFVRPTGIIS